MTISAACAAGLTVQVFPADWANFGRSAGLRRNAALVASLGAGDVLVAFWDGPSRGTAHSISLARAAGVRVFVYGPSGALLP